MGIGKAFVMGVLGIVRNQHAVVPQPFNQAEAVFQFLGGELSLLSALMTFFPVFCAR